MKIRKASSQSVVEYFKQNRTLSIFPFDKLKNNVHHFQNKYYALVLKPSCKINKFLQSVVKLLYQIFCRKDEVINGRSQKFENIYIVKTVSFSLQQILIYSLYIKFITPGNYFIVKKAPM